MKESGVISAFWSKLLRPARFYISTHGFLASYSCFRMPVGAIISKARVASQPGTHPWFQSSSFPLLITRDVYDLLLAQHVSVGTFTFLVFYFFTLSKQIIGPSFCTLNRGYIPYCRLKVRCSTEISIINFLLSLEQSATSTAPFSSSLYSSDLPYKLLDRSLYWSLVSLKSESFLKTWPTARFCSWCGCPSLSS